MYYKQPKTEEDLEEMRKKMKDRAKKKLKNNILMNVKEKTNRMKAKKHVNKYYTVSGARG